MKSCMDERKKMEKKLKRLYKEAEEEEEEGMECVRGERRKGKRNEQEKWEYKDK